GTALTSKDTADDFRAVVQASVPQHVPERSHGPGLGVFGPVDHSCQPGRGHRPGAHGARLQGDDERQPGQPPAAERPGRLPDRDDLRVRGGIVVYLPAVAGPRDNRARLIEDDGAARDVLEFGPMFGPALGCPSQGCFLEREPRCGLERTGVSRYGPFALNNTPST